jgi:RNA polymerase sigma-70 factor (ECF subfamily)
MTEGAPLEEIERVYRCRLADFVRVAIAITGTVEGGREAVHDGFVAAIRSRHAYRGDGPLEAWLWQVVVNSARKSRRVERDHIWLSDVEQSDHVSNDSADDLAVVRMTIGRLPERQRLVLFLRYYADLDYSAIGELLGIRPGTVGATLNAAHAFLHSALQEVKHP